MRSIYRAIPTLIFLLVISTIGLASPAPIEPLASQSLLLDGTRAGERLIVVGERGHILTSDDHGDSWTQSQVPTRVTLTAVFFTTAEQGWAVGHDATILHSKDGGKTWQQIYADPTLEAPLFDIHFINPQHGIAIGAYGLYLSSHDGGRHWHKKNISDDADVHLNHLSQADNGHLTIAAEAGIIYTSDDNGDSWRSLTSPYHGSFFGSLPLANTLLLYGLRGHLFTSPDQGKHWQALDSHTQAMLTNGLRLSNGDVLLTGHNGVILYRRPGESGFTLRPQQSRTAISAAIEAATGKVWLVGEQGIQALQDHTP